MRLDPHRSSLRSSGSPRSGSRRSGASDERAIAGWEAEGGTVGDVPSAPRAPFRALFLVRDSLDHVEVVPLTGVQAAPEAPLGGVLSGTDELLAFIREIGFDGIVESYQVSDAPRTGFLYTFHLAPSPEAIVALLAERLVPEVRETYRVLALADEKAPEQLALSPHEAFQLGASELAATAGVARVREWFEARKLPGSWTEEMPDRRGRRASRNGAASRAPTPTAGFARKSSPRT